MIKTGIREYLQGISLCIVIPVLRPALEDVRTVEIEPRAIPQFMMHLLEEKVNGVGQLVQRCKLDQKRPAFWRVNVRGKLNGE